MVEKIYLFKPSYERVYYFFLFAFLALAFAVLFGVFRLPTFENMWLRLLVYFLFFNTLHTVLSFVGLVMLPELRSWVVTQFRPKRFIVVASIFTAIFYGAVVHLDHLNLQNSTDRILKVVFVLLITVHNLSQIKGLSLMYNRIARSLLTEAEQTRQLKIERAERLLFDSLIVVKAATAVCFALFREQVGNGFFSFMHALFVIVTAILLLNGVRYPKLFATNKFWLLQGVWFFAIMPLYPSVFALQMCLHGLEYVFISQIALDGSALKMSRRWVTVAASLVALFAISKVLDSRITVSNGLPPAVMWVIISFGTIVEYGHYYIDSMIFRFKDPAVRASVGPLFSR